MRSHRWTVPLSTAVAVLVVVTTVSCTAPGPAAAPADGSVRFSAGDGQQDGRCVVAAAGDVAGEDDHRVGAARTAELITSTRPRAVLALGDLAYGDGTAAEFADWYDTTWGAFRSITAPTPGNHEYRTDGKGYYDYFDVEPDYAFDLCGWRIVSVDQYAGMDAAVDFIEAEGRESGARPLLVFWHEPRFSSGSTHGSEPDVQPLWEAAVSAGADIVLNAHDHHYERFEPLDADGDPRADGTVEFVSGNGGHHLRDTGDRELHSAAVATGVPGVLFLQLRVDGYDWAYTDVEGRTGDEGVRQLE